MWEDFMCENRLVGVNWLTTKGGRAMSEREELLKQEEEEPDVVAHKPLTKPRGEGEAPEGQGERSEDEEPDVVAHKHLHKGG
jgi:hypothetical protein